MSRHPVANTVTIHAATNDDDEEYVFTTCPEDEQVHVALGKQRIPKRLIQVQGQQVEMIVDTGASVNILESHTYDSLRVKPTLQPTTTRVFPYGATTPLSVLGMANFELQHNGEQLSVPFHVIEGNSGNLLGYAAAENLKILTMARQITTADDKVKVIEDYSDLFEGMGKVKDRLITLHIDETVTPKQQKHRRIPFHIRKDVERELARLEADDVIEKTDGPTPWVSPIVVVPKKTGAVRICVDMREANKAVKREKHLMPTIDDLITDLNGATMFSTLDLRAGYHQLELDPESRQITTFSTHVALYRYKRLMFGINAASEIFQNTIAELLHGLNGCRNISDDIIVHGKTPAEHNANLRAVLDRLRENNVRLNREKCKFSQPTVTFYGHVFGAHGLRADPKKLESISKARRPTNPSEVRSLLGMAQYVSRFIADFANIVAPLRELTKQDELWNWQPKHEQSFQALTHALTNTSTMTYFDPNKSSEVFVDASPLGLGAILTQNGKVVSYASRALSDVERRYSQTEREMLAVVWSAEHFHLYLYGASFTIHTDHQPLLGIFKSQRPASARIERWRLRLLPYQFELKYRPGKDDRNPADYISRHPYAKGTTDSTEEYVRYICNAAIPKAMTAVEVKEHTATDVVLQALTRAIQTGRWDDTLVHDYVHVKNELTTCSGIVLRGTRIVLPSILQQRAVELAHVGHQGVVKTKMLLREKVWFPAIDSMAERQVKSCLACQATISTPMTPEPMISTPIPSAPWKNLSADFLGPLPTGELILVVIDDFSRFPEVEIVTSTAASSVIPKLDSMFARHGIPDVLKSDNGPPFNGSELTKFAQYLGFQHKKITPIWPCANGEAERFMAPLMKAIRAAHVENRSWKQELYNFLRQYRATPHCTTGVSPAEALYGRKLNVTLPQLPQQTRVSELHEKLQRRDTANKAKSKDYSDKRRNAKPSQLQVGEIVLVRQPRRNKLTTPFDPRPLEVVRRKGTLVTAKRGMYTITRNISHFKRLNATHSLPHDTYHNDTDDFDFTTDDNTRDNTHDNTLAKPTLKPCLSSQVVRRSSRLRKPPVRFKDFTE